MPRSGPWKWTNISNFHLKMFKNSGMKEDSSDSKVQAEECWSIAVCMSKNSIQKGREKSCIDQIYFTNMQQVILYWSGKTITGRELNSDNKTTKIEDRANILFPRFQTKNKRIIKILARTSRMTGSCHYDHFVACKHPFIAIVQSNINPRDTLLV